jgi:hypothetical protein
VALTFSSNHVEDSLSLSLFRYYKKLAEGAMEQVSDDQLAAVLDPEMNSISQIVKHMSGNMRSRWTDFLTSDGEKPTRNRDDEFEPARALFVSLRANRVSGEASGEPELELAQHSAKAVGRVQQGGFGW